MGEALKVAYRETVSLIPYARNARTHSDAQIDQIIASIKEFGWTNPILVDGDNGILAGHGRVLAAHRMGAAQVPVIELAHLSDAQRRAYILADNKLALNAGWDDALVAAELTDLKAMGADLQVIGFDEDELAALFGGETGQSGAGNLAARFGVAPFSVLNAREGWWQDRKRAWLALGIQSEIGRGDDMVFDQERLDAFRQGGPAKPKGAAEPGGSKRPAADYGKTKARGDGRGRSING